MASPEDTTSSLAVLIDAESKTFQFQMHQRCREVERMTNSEHFDASGNFKVFYQHVRKLSDRCVGYSTVAHMKGTAFSEKYSFFRKNVDLPVLEVESNQVEDPEVCFLVEGLARTSEINSSPLSAVTFCEVLAELFPRCGKDHAFVLGEKQKPKGLPDRMGDYICPHLPIEKITIEADHRQAILRLYVVPIDERRGHLHYGSEQDQNAERVLHKSQAGVM